EVVLGGTYLSGSDPLYTFAAGTAQDMTIEVAWRRGGHSVIHAVKANREYQIEEPPYLTRLTPGANPGIPGSVSPPTTPEPRPPAPCFRDASRHPAHRPVRTPLRAQSRP